MTGERGADFESTVGKTAGQKGNSPPADEQGDAALAIVQDWDPPIIVKRCFSAGAAPLSAKLSSLL